MKKLTDKEIEKERYNKRSIELINKNSAILENIGPQSFPYYIRKPYNFYHRLIQELAASKNPINHLDLCCGDGIHSFTTAKEGARVVGVDIADHNILLAQARAKALNLAINFMVNDVESLSFEDQEFDLITCVGSLSYLDHDIFICEVKRLLKPEGKLIILDSLNHNIAYKLNRYFHYIRGRRSRSTLKRMPDKDLIRKFQENFSKVNIEYFGIFVFLIPILKIFFSEKRIAKLLDFLDRSFQSYKFHSFKIVLTARK